MTSILQLKRKQKSLNSIEMSEGCFLPLRLSQRIRHLELLLCEIIIIIINIYSILQF